MGVEQPKGSINRLTALIILTRGDDIHCTSAGPVVSENGKYVGWITLGPDDRYRPLLNTEPIYNSHEEAKAAMEAFVKEIRDNPNKVW